MKNTSLKSKNITRSYLIFLWLLLAPFLINGQHVSVYPPHWWTGMKYSTIQLMVHGKAIAKEKPAVTISYPGVSIQKLLFPENENYIFIDIAISPDALPGKFNIQVKGKKTVTNLNYELHPRRTGNGSVYAQGVTSEDFVYLLIPDRFSNGDPSNDKIAGLRDQSLNRDSIYHRHGGDLQGVINHLDYLQDLGVTTIWMTPVIQNDMPDRTEHGYAFTNHYRVEPRLGGEDLYRKLSDELHKRGMKLMQDAVYNHVGLYHHTVQDKPMPDWLHEWLKFTQTSYKDQTLFDQYAAPSERKRMSDGWFTHMMPDMNQGNPFVANYLIQHAIWSVEEFGVDGWRIDTYIYNDLEFMNRCNQALLAEYPNISLFGETWVHGVINQSYFAENNLNTSFKSNLPAVTDFQSLFYGITPALNDKFGWTDGVNKLYQTMSNDIAYKDPMKQVVFLDNHDLSRFFSIVNEDLNKIKVAYSWLLTTRGVPQMYYGSEVLMKGHTNPDGWVRLDFPGGWPGDKADKFKEAGRTKPEQEVFSLIKSLAQFRKQSSALKAGKYMHYLPVDGQYVYFRYDNNQTVMCVMNTSDKEKEIDFSRYAERTNGFATAKDVLAGKSTSTKEKIKISPMTMLVLELGK
jgi:neopullulanase